MTHSKFCCPQYDISRTAEAESSNFAHIKSYLSDNKLSLKGEWSGSHDPFSWVTMRHHAKFRGYRSNRYRDVAIIRFLQDGGRPPSLICDLCVGTTHEGHLVVFVTVQSMVRIDAVVLIICIYLDFANLA